METLYKLVNDQELYYKEMWYDSEREVVVTHWGKVGFTGKHEEFPMSSTEAEHFARGFESSARNEGYAEFPEEKQVVVVIQFPMKSNNGNKRYKWLGAKCSDYLQNHLAWRGLGLCEGENLENKKLNIFCIVVDEDRAVSSIKTCLKTYRLDLTRAIIAARRYDEDGEFRVRYSLKPVAEFSLV